jgi:hypothetical protein
VNLIEVAVPDTGARFVGLEEMTVLQRTHDSCGQIADIELVAHSAELAKHLCRLTAQYQGNGGGCEALARVGALSDTVRIAPEEARIRRPSLAATSENS